MSDLTRRSGFQVSSIEVEAHFAVRPADLVLCQAVDPIGRAIAMATRSWACHVAMVIDTFDDGSWRALEVSPRSLWPWSRGDCDVRLEPRGFYAHRPYRIVRPELGSGPVSDAVALEVAATALSDYRALPSLRYPIPKLLGYALRRELRRWVSDGPAGVCSRRCGEPWSRVGLVWRDGDRELDVRYEVTPATILRQSIREGWKGWSTPVCPDGVA